MIQLQNERIVKTQSAQTAQRHPRASVWLRLSMPCTVALGRGRREAGCEIGQWTGLFGTRVQ
jgi:hypothetical protein